jgi:hypothetical protein
MQRKTHQQILGYNVRDINENGETSGKGKNAKQAPTGDGVGEHVVRDGFDWDSE